MNERQLALAVALSLAAAPVLAGAIPRGGDSSSSSSGASDRQPSSGGGSSGGGSSWSPSSSGSSSGSSGSSWSGSSHSSGSGATARHPGSSGGSSGGGSSSGSSATTRHPRPHSGSGDRGHGGYVPRGGSYDHYWRSRPYTYRWGWYPYGGYYDGYYWGYYGWGAPYSSRYVYNYDVGSLRIMVEPDDAEVYVDGYYAGEVDDFNGVFQRLHVRPGQHEIALKRRGYRTHRIKVYVPVGGTLKVHYEMERGQATDVTESVVGSPADLEPNDGGRGPAADDEQPSADVPSAPPTRRPADVTLSIKPQDAAVYVDGRFMGNGADVDELQLVPGKHRIEVVRPGFATYDKELDVASGESREVKIELEKTASPQ